MGAEQNEARRFGAKRRKGVWVLTDLGRQAAEWPANKVKKASADANKALYAARKASVAAIYEPPLSNSDRAANTGADDWNDTLLSRLKTIDPTSFERLCQRVLRESGFIKVEVTGKSGDGGIDGAGVLRMNLISFQVLFQCKRYAGSVSSGTIRDFRGAMQGRADKGLIITTGSFTAEARKEATRDGAPAIDLIDGDALCHLLKDLRLGVIVKQVITEEIVVDSAFLETI